MIELVNTLTSPELGTATTPGVGTGPDNASVLDLAGFQSNPPLTTPWDGGCWDLVFTEDDPTSRPDPILGQLQPGGKFHGLIPLTSASFNTTSGADPLIYPLPQAIQAGASLAQLYVGIPAMPPGTNNPLAPPRSYFMTIGSPLLLQRSS